MSLNDDLWKLDADLAKYPEDVVGSAINRRLILRQFAEKIGRDEYQRGYSDGARDEHDASRRDDEIRAKREEDSTDA